ncbi:MAG: HAMP domain-containing histidine kinase [Nitrospirae bacterium]|nr:HAMP domain-containing histidine kinase [Nitrospirota bacterium]MDA8339054.1 HAMP domain-containing sensor histidine kinase [Nitrospiraceae bacterium]
MNQNFTYKILKTISPFPFIIKTDKIALSNGLFFSYPRFCHKNLDKKKCNDVYKSLIYDHKIEHVKCPHGFSIFTALCNNEKIAFSGLIAFPENNYCPKEFRKLYSSNKVESTKILQWFDYLKDSVMFFENMVQEQTKAVIASLHDIQKTNSLIKSNAENLINKQKGSTADDKFNNSPESLKAIFKASELLSNQMELISLFSNPDMILAGRKRHFEVFRFFDKMRLLYSSKAETKWCRIILKGPFSSAIQVCDSFALIPHILIDNAVKYSQKNENIHVSFEDIANKIIIKIKSCGPPILQEETELIFEKFVKGKLSVSCSSEGSGIGLYVAKNIIEKHGGKISVESKIKDENKDIPLADNTFIIEIPKI